MSKRIFLAYIVAPLLVGCYSANEQIEPQLSYSVQDKYIEHLRAPFPPLSSEEMAEPWGIEYQIAHSLARQLDLYQAISTFKRAQILMGEDNPDRKMEAQYFTLLCYHFGKKFEDVIYTFEESSLCMADPSFVPYSDMLVIVHEAYLATEQDDKANYIAQVLKQVAPDIAYKTELSEQIMHAALDKLAEKTNDPAPKENINQLLSVVAKENKSMATPGEAVIEKLSQNIAAPLNQTRNSELEHLTWQAQEQETLSEVLTTYNQLKLSPTKAGALNALLPGAGYLYVGQKQSAITSFFINTLFIAATAHFISRGHVAAGVITAGFEAGWYFGGIYGAGEAAKLYNERLYEGYAHSHLRQNSLYPVLMLSYGF